VETRQLDRSTFMVSSSCTESIARKAEGTRVSQLCADPNGRSSIN
jgi:hypothetical protein